jgi:hypothetical protein
MVTGGETLSALAAAWMASHRAGGSDGRTADARRAGELGAAAEGGESGGLFDRRNASTIRRAD